MASEDGGRTFHPIKGTVVHLLYHSTRALHLDHHDLWIDPKDPDRLLLGNDGGLFISRDRGKNWLSISTGLPERHVTWRLVQDHVNPALLFAATEFGVFFTIDNQTWTKLSGGTPNISFRDLAIQKRENDLVGATFGRSFYVFDDYTPLRSVTAKKLASDTMLFPVRDALWYLQRMPLGEFRTGSKASQGDAYFVADNPPFGAVITYYLPKAIQTGKE